MSGSMPIGNSSVAWLDSVVGAISYSDPVVHISTLITVSKDSGDPRTEMLIPRTGWDLLELDCIQWRERISIVEVP